jgi:hypothetical protein
MNNMKLIEAKTVGAGGVASVSFNSIPATYTDLQIVMSVRGSAVDAFRGMYFTINSSASDFAGVYLQGGGSGNAAAGSLARYLGTAPCAGATANSFSSVQLYIPNYRLALLKTMTADLIAETNGTQSFQEMTTNRWSVTSPITDITFALDSGNIVQNSTFYLYGIESTVQGGAKAYGGYVTEDSSYFYHTFFSTSTFTPLQSLTADVLVIAGAGGGGSGFYGGGGGAGGVCYQTGRSLTATSYAIVVGSGGAGSTNNSNKGSNGGNSTLDGITAVGGGGGGSRSNVNGADGGSGGGGAQAGSGSTGGAATQGNSSGATGYGFRGGNVSAGANIVGTGGGGAGTQGEDKTSNGSAAGNGGNGLNTWSTWANATQTGFNGYYAGGGASSSDTLAGGTGGLGGGGNGLINANGNSGIVNTGGGGAGGGGNVSAGGNGGSGIVIVRYAK